MTTFASKAKQPAPAPASVHWPVRAGASNPAQLSEVRNILRPNEAQAKLVQRETKEDEEKAQAKLVQREAKEDEEKAQAKLVQRETKEDEEKAQAKQGAGQIRPARGQGGRGEGAGQAEHRSAERSI